MSFWWKYFFNFHHAPSVWTHRSLRLWWQQLLSLSNWLLPPFCLLQGSRIIHFYFLLKRHAFQACNQVFSNPSPLHNHRWFSFMDHSFVFEIFEASRIEIWIWNYIEKKVNHIFTLVSSNASILNWKEFYLILCASMTVMYLSTGILSMSVDVLIWDRWPVALKNENEKCNVSEIAVDVQKQ